MALDKVTYVDNENVIYADNLNDIQDAIIAAESDLVDIHAEIDGFDTKYYQIDTAVADAATAKANAAAAVTTANAASAMAAQAQSDAAGAVAAAEDAEDAATAAQTAAEAAQDAAEAAEAAWDNFETDKTLSVVDKAADAAAVGGVKNAAVKFIRNLTATDDLFTLTDIGMYIATSVSVATGIANNGNGPTKVPFVLTLFGKTIGNTTSASKSAILINQSGIMWISHKLTENATWTPWQRIARYYETLHQEDYLTSSADLDDVYDSGKDEYFIVKSWVTSGTPANAPGTGNGFVVSIKTTAGYGTAQMAQIVYQASGIYYRFRGSSGWTDWIEPIKRDEAFVYQRILTSADDLNSESLAMGLYKWMQSSRPANSPTSDSGMLLQFRAPLDATNLTKIQIVSNNNGKMWSRWCKAAGTWMPWVGFAQTDSLVELTGSFVTGDFDNYGNSMVGIYKKNKNSVVTNTPTNNSGVLLVLAASKTETGFCTQIFIDSSGQQFVRYCNTSGVWTEWLTQSNIRHDLPDSQGTLNIVMRAYQLTKLEITPVANMPRGSTNFYPQGEPMIGVPYSSVRVEAPYVGAGITLDTFMSAAKNPNSYLYTKRLTNYNASTFYGDVCSSMVGYCYGIDTVIPTTISFATYPGFNRLPDSKQNPYGLKLGDMLNKVGNHIVIVTDIGRTERGRIEYIEVSEAWSPNCRSVKYSPARIQSRYFDDGFVAYEYEYRDSVPYIPSPWVNLDGESGFPTWNTNLMPRRGDKANWFPGEDIEIDVMDAGTYTQYRVENVGTGAVIASGNIPSGNLITLSGYSVGRYRCYLTDGTVNSNPVYFNMMDDDNTYTAIGNGQVRVEFNSALGEAASICFSNNAPSDSDYQAVRAFHVLTDEEIAAGYAVVTQPASHGPSETTDGKWLMRVCFKTEFGLYSSPLREVKVIE